MNANKIVIFERASKKNIKHPKNSTKKREVKKRKSQKKIKKEFNRKVSKFLITECQVKGNDSSDGYADDQYDLHKPYETDFIDDESVIEPSQYYDFKTKTLVSK